MRDLVLQGRGNMDEFEGTLKKALESQKGLLSRILGEHPDIVAAHEQTATDMQIDLVSLHAS